MNQTDRDQRAIRALISAGKTHEVWAAPIHAVDRELNSPPPNRERSWRVCSGGVRCKSGWKRRTGSNIVPACSGGNWATMIQTLTLLE